MSDTVSRRTRSQLTTKEQEEQTVTKPKQPVTNKNVSKTPNTHITPSLSQKKKKSVTTPSYSRPSSVQYSYHVSPTVSLYCSSSTAQQDIPSQQVVGIKGKRGRPSKHPSSSSSSLGRGKRKRGRGKRGGDSTSSGVFDFCSDEELEEEEEEEEERDNNIQTPTIRKRGAPSNRGNNKKKPTFKQYTTSTVTITNKVHQQVQSVRRTSTRSTAATSGSSSSSIKSSLKRSPAASRRSTRKRRKKEDTPPPDEIEEEEEEEELPIVPSVEESESTQEDSPIKDDAITTGDIMSKDTKCDDLLKESNTTTVSEEDDTLIQYSTSDDQGQEEKEEMEDAVVTMDTNNNDNTTSDNISNINTKDDGLPPEEEEEEEDHEGTEDLNKAMDTNNTVSVEEKEEEGDGVVEDIMDQTLIASDNDSTAPASDSSVKEKNSTNMKMTKSCVIPVLSRSSTWPKTAISNTSSGFTTCTYTTSNQLAPSVTIVKNVRQAHECLEHGENLQFSDEVRYLLDNMKSDQSLSVRCLSALNLSQECLDADFMRQMRSRGLTNRALLLLKDIRDHQTLQVAIATLFYVMTRSKFDSNELDRKCIELLMTLLSIKESYQLVTDDERRGEEKPPLEGKELREFNKITEKSKSILQKCPPLSIQSKHKKEEEEKEEEEGNEDTPIITLSPSTLSLGELASECFLSLTTTQTNFHLLKEEMRLHGTIDIIANRAISLANLCSKYINQQCTDDKEGEEKGEELHLLKLLRQLELLENILCMNKSNQSYLTVFDGSHFVIQISKILVLLGNRLEKSDCLKSRQKCIYMESLLGGLRVFLNMTHDNPLGSHRIGEQKEFVEAIFKYIFKLPVTVPDNYKFDLLVLSLSLLINLLENNPSNREYVCIAKLDPLVTQEEEEEDNDPYGNMLVSDALIKLFMVHYERVKVASVDVPTPQHLSQNTPHSSPIKSPRKGERGKLLFNTQSKSIKSDDKTEHEKDKDQEEEEEEEEEVLSDSLVFSREDFDSALTQAGHHVEDSILSSYTAVLLAILVKNNVDFMSTLKDSLPSGNFSTLIQVLKDFLSLMRVASSASTRSGLDSVQRIIKSLEGMETTQQ